MAGSQIEQKPFYQILKTKITILILVVSFFPPIFYVASWNC